MVPVFLSFLKFRALDDPNSFCAMEKQKLVVYQNDKIQDEFQASGCNFSAKDNLFRLDTIFRLSNRACLTR